MIIKIMQMQKQEQKQEQEHEHRCENCSKVFKREVYLTRHIAKNICGGDKEKDVYESENENENIKEIMIVDSGIRTKKNVSASASVSASVSNVDGGNMNMSVSNELKNVMKNENVIDEVCGSNEVLYRLLRVMESIDKKMDVLADIVGNISCRGGKRTVKMHSVRKGRLPLNDSFVNECLIQRTPKTDASMLYEYYIEGKPLSQLPIKKKANGSVSYWDGDSWVDERYPHLLKDILCTNIIKTYRAVNRISSISMQHDYLDRQGYINKLGDKKYQTQIMNIFLDSISVS